MGASLSIAAVMAERSARIERRDVAGAALVSEVLVHLGAATPFMEAEARGIRSRGPLRRPPLTPAQWALLWTDRARDPVAALASALWPAVLATCARPDRDAGLQPRHRVDLGRTQVTLARSLGYASELLAVPTPRLFLFPQVVGGLGHCAAWPLASCAGNTLLSGHDPETLLAVCGQHAAFLHPDLYLVTLLGTGSSVEEMSTLRARA